jgi:hypothetical protein
LGICAHRTVDLYRARRRRRALTRGTPTLALESTDLQWATFIAAVIVAVTALAVVIIYVIQTYIMIQTRVGTSVIEAVQWMESDEMRRRRAELYRQLVTHQRRSGPMAVAPPQVGQPKVALRCGPIRPKSAKLRRRWNGVQPERIR